MLNQINKKFRMFDMKNIQFQGVAQDQLLYPFLYVLTLSFSGFCALTKSQHLYHLPSCQNLELVQKHTERMKTLLVNMTCLNITMSGKDKQWYYQFSCTHSIPPAEVPNIFMLTSWAFCSTVPHKRLRYLNCQTQLELQYSYIARKK